MAGTTSGAVCGRPAEVPEMTPREEGEEGGRSPGQGQTGLGAEQQGPVLGRPPEAQEGHSWDGRKRWAPPWGEWALGPGEP